MRKNDQQGDKKARTHLERHLVPNRDENVPSRPAHTPSTHTPSTHLDLPDGLPARYTVHQGGLPGSGTTHQRSQLSRLGESSDTLEEGNGPMRGNVTDQIIK